ncbi:MAG: choice-of-anchor tandem repeat GloVer-containing protein [Candidatus Sulfotelmatobacter sp.]|jgi:uncharacterized repeat protein (TIGR03803 family)
MNRDPGNIARQGMNKLGFMKRPSIVSLLCVAAAIASPAQTFTTLHNFDGTDGADPDGLVQGTDGNFYGTTGNGGAINPCFPNGGGPGCGTVFQITPRGVLTTLHSFDGTDGYAPNGLVQGSDGKFYGTTATSIYSIVPGGTPVLLTSVSGPQGPLVQGTDGNFYGTTAGGFGSSCPGDCGTVFKITPAGTLTTLYTFDGTGGIGPNGGLVQGTDGNFYGTTALGGALGCGPSDPQGDCGTIFKNHPTGHAHLTLQLLHATWGLS